MQALQLLPIGNVDPGLLEWLRRELIEGFRIPCEILDPPLDRSFKKPGGYVMREKLAAAREAAGQEKPKARSR